MMSTNNVMVFTSTQHMRYANLVATGQWPETSDQWVKQKHRKILLDDHYKLFIIE